MLASAHAVVLASGTLAPVSSLKQQLFPGVPATQLHQFSCGHVVRAQLVTCHLCIIAFSMQRASFPCLECINWCYSRMLVRG